VFSHGTLLAPQVCLDLNFILLTWVVLPAHECCEMISFF
jgi:hypothetical protein